MSLKNHKEVCKGKCWWNIFLFPKRSFPSGLIPDQKCHLINTLSIKQGLSKIQKKKVLVFVFLPFIMSAGARGGAGAPRITA